MTQKKDTPKSSNQKTGLVGDKKKKSKENTKLRARLKARLKLRELTGEDYEDVVSLQRRCYPEMPPWDRDQFVSQVTVFPQGQIGIELDGKLVANSASLIVDLDELGRDHDYDEATDRGYFTNHDLEGDTLYGVELSVDPDHRGLRLARRMYDARKKLVADMNLRRMIIGGRMPRYHRRAHEISPEEYLQQVMAKKIRDPVITAQIANGFAILKPMRDYLPEDKSSGGHAILMEWLNTKYVPPTGSLAGRGRVRVASVQYGMRRVNSFDEFMTGCEFFIDTAADFRADFVVFPELLTTQLFPLLPEGRPGVTARLLDQFTRDYVEFFRRMSIEYAVNIIGGSHLTMEGEDLYNIAYLFRRDGSTERQKKIHPAPAEFRWWGVKPGDKLKVFPTDRGKIAILTCYDVEFPELARIAVSKGARILFVPYNTDIRRGHLRVPLLRPRSMHRKPRLLRTVRSHRQPPFGERRRHPLRPVGYPHTVRHRLFPRRCRRRGQRQHRDPPRPRVGHGRPSPNPPHRHGAPLARPPHRPLPHHLPRRRRKKRDLVPHPGTNFRDGELVPPWSGLYFVEELPKRSLLKVGVRLEARPQRLLRHRSM